MDIPLSLVFYKWMLNQENNLSLADLKHVDEAVAQTILQLEKLAAEKKDIESDKSLVRIVIFTFKLYSKFRY